MAGIPWLQGDPAFPPPERALQHPNGLLAAGGALDPEWLLCAYRQGIFPWFNEGEPILWWSPDPRLILVPSELRVHRSLRKTLRNGGFEVRFDTDFEAVMAGCAGPRAQASGTWITPHMRQAYLRMHAQGHAHSVEVLRDGVLVGGLYGIAIGRAFFGESMFSRTSNASKVALVHLVAHLVAHDFGVIDCQMTTPHLLSLGAREVPRALFQAILAELTPHGPAPGRWSMPPQAWKPLDLLSQEPD